MRIAWLLPVRDGGALLGRAVASALQACESDDEVLVIDDGSVDGAAMALPTHPQLRVLRQPPLGIVAALEHGRAATTAPLLARLDADDEALPGRIAAQRAALQPGVVVVGGQGLLEEGGEGMVRYVRWLNGLEDLHAALLIESPLLHPAVLMRASAVAAVGGYRQGDFPEDYDLWLRLAEVGRLVSVAQPVVRLSDRPGRLTRTDPRYRPEAFRRLKIAWVARNLLPSRPRVGLWGANKAGKPWLRALIEHDRRPVGLFDIAPGGSRQGLPVWPIEALADTALDLLLVAVGARGARDEIRARLGALRPDLIEGVGWFAVC